MTADQNTPNSEDPVLDQCIDRLIDGSVQSGVAVFSHDQQNAMAFELYGTDEAHLCKKSIVP